MFRRNAQKDAAITFCDPTGAHDVYKLGINAINGICLNPAGANVSVCNWDPKYPLDVTGTIHYTGSNCCHQFTTDLIHSTNYIAYNIGSTLGDGICTATVIYNYFYAVATVIIYGSSVMLINTTMSNQITLSVISGLFGIFNNSITSLVAYSVTFQRLT